MHSTVHFDEIVFQKVIPLPIWLHWFIILSTVSAETRKQNIDLDKDTDIFTWFHLDKDKKIYFYPEKDKDKYIFS